MLFRTRRKFIKYFMIIMHSVSLFLAIFALHWYQHDQWFEKTGNQH